MATRKNLRVGRLAKLSLGLIVAQCLIGIANVLWSLPAELTVLHTACAAAIGLTAAMLLREVLMSPVGTQFQPARTGFGAEEVA